MLFQASALLLFVAAVANAQVDCAAEKEKVKTCVQDLFAGTTDDREAKKAAKDACFVDAGCTSPSEKFAALRECKKEALDQLKPQLESCVQETIPGFTLPEKSGHRGGRRGGKRGGRRGHGKGKHGNKGDFLSELCPSQEAQDAVKECLQGLRDEKRANRGGGNRRDRKAKFEELKACKADFPEECKLEYQEERKAIKATICGCAASTLADNSEVVNQLAQCHNDNDGDDDDDEVDAEEFSKRLVAKFCREEKRREGGKGRREGGKGRRGGKGRGRRGGQ